jgi:hypothetical protein
MNPILINLIVVILIFGLTTYMNIKTKFAKDEKEAMRHAKTLALDLALLLLCIWSAYRLFVDLLSDAPLDRRSLLIILINSFSLFYVFMVTFHLNRIVSLIEKILKSPK